MPNKKDTEVKEGGSSSGEEVEYSVERIISKRIVEGKTEYFLKWMGYPENENTWESVDRLNCPDLIQEFEDNLKKKKDDKPASRSKQPATKAKKRSLNTLVKKDDSKKEEDHGASTSKPPREEKNKKDKEVREGGSSSGEEEEYSVERIISKRIVEGKTEYFLKWMGYPENENTWEPVDRLNCPDLIQEFEDNLKKKKDDKPASRSKQPATKAKKRSLNTLVKKDDSKKEEDHGASTSKPPRQEKNEANAKMQNEDIPKGFDRNLDPLKIVGATDSSGELMYLMTWKGTDEADLVPAKIANHRCPQIVIQFYEERLTWHTPPSKENFPS